MSQFTEFKRNVGNRENFKDFLARFQRAITKLKSLGMGMNDDMVCRKAIQSLRLPEGQLPIVMSALETTGEATSIKALRELTIKCTRRIRHPSIRRKYIALFQRPHRVTNRNQMEKGMQNGKRLMLLGRFSLWGQKKTKSRNATGDSESSRRGAMSHFKGAPNRKSYPKGKGKTQQ